MKKIIIVAALIMGMTSVCLAQNYQDVLYLKNGDVVKGEIISQIIGESITIMTEKGTIISFRSQDIDKLEKEKSSTYSFGKPKGLFWGIDLSIGWIVQPSVTIGYRFSPYFEFGVGSGVISTIFNLVEGGVPVYAHLASNILPNKKVSPYISCNGGYMFPIWWLDSKRYASFQGVFVEPAVGVSFNISKNRAFVALGCDFVNSSPLMELKLGMTF